LLLDVAFAGWRRLGATELVAELQGAWVRRPCKLRVATYRIAKAVAVGI